MLLEITDIHVECFESVLQLWRDLIRWLNVQSRIKRDTINKTMVLLSRGFIAKNTYQILILFVAVSKKRKVMEVGVVPLMVVKMRLSTTY